MFPRSRLYLVLSLFALLFSNIGWAAAHYSATQMQTVQAALGTAFTYQGQLTSTGAPVNGNCDMAFSLYDDVAAGAQIGAAITTTVPVSNGVFTTQLDFGSGVFVGDARWLSIAVKCGADPSFTTIAPRHALTAVPYSLYADSVKWENITGKPTSYYPLMRPQTLDLTTVDPALKGFIGGFSDGRYGYFVPYSDGGAVGKVARVDLQNFAAGGVTVLDLTTVDPALKGFEGGFTDGRYGYFAPQDSSGTPFGKVARVDLQNFITSSVTVLDLTIVDPSLKGFYGGFTDGRYGYFVPCCNPAPFGKVARVDLQNFAAGGVTVLDLTTVDPSLKGFVGGFTDGRYGYFVPTDNGTFFGKVARVDLQAAAGGVTVLDLTTVDPDLKGFVGGFTDGRYGYFVPNINGTFFGKVARVDLQNFAAGGVVVLDLTTVDASLKGFHGGFTDGRYGYFVPSSNGAEFGKVARVDLQNFTTSGVTWLDMELTDSGLKGFAGGFSDGRFGYFVPYNNGAPFGKIARIQLFSGAGAP